MNIWEKDRNFFLELWIGKLCGKMSIISENNPFFLELIEILTRYLKEELQKEKKREYFVISERSSASIFCVDFLKDVTNSFPSPQEKRWIIAKFVKLIYPVALTHFLKEP